MTFLDCSVTGCTYNTDRCCSKNDIQIEGRNAKRNAQTCCSSFRERKADGVSNESGNASKMTEVACDACDCQFNKDKKCSAEHIGIAGGDACTCKETECASFCCCH